MKARVQRIRIRLVAALISTATFLSTIAAANAGNPQILLCESARGQANSAAGPINLPNLSTSYQIDAQGCVLAQGFGDIAIFRSAGFSEAGKERSIVFNSGVASGTTSFQIGSIPAGAYLQQVIFFNLTANAVTGGINVGSTSGGNDIASATTVGANAVAASTLLKTVFSTTAPQPVFITAANAWNSANVNVTLVYAYF